MEMGVLIPLILAGVFLVADLALLVRMVRLLRKYQDDTVERFGKKLNPYLCAAGVVSVLMAVCMMIVIIAR